MKTATLATLVLLTRLSLVASPHSFTTISLAPVANFKLDHLTAPPSGQKTLKGVPFEFPESGKAFRTEGLFVEASTTAGLTTDVSRPTAVYILLSGTYVKREFKDKKVGEITLEFADGSAMTVPIKAWQTLRDTWAYPDEIQEPNSHGNPKLVNVLTEDQIRGNRPATAFLDMLIIDLGRTKRSTALSSISIRDTSRETVGDIAPSLIVSGITVQHE